MPAARKSPAPGKTAREAAAPTPSSKRAAPAASAQAAAAAKPQAAKPAKPPKADKPKKPKLVRDSFTIPKPEYAVLQDLKDRATRLGRPAKKSEVLRAGIKALAVLPDTALVAALAAVPPLKTGRPPKAQLA